MRWRSHWLVTLEVCTTLNLGETFCREAAAAAAAYDRVTGGRGHHSPTAIVRSFKLARRASRRGSARLLGWAAHLAQDWATVPPPKLLGAAWRSIHATTEAKLEKRLTRSRVRRIAAGLAGERRVARLCGARSPEERVVGCTIAVMRAYTHSLVGCIPLLASRLGVVAAAALAAPALGAPPPLAALIAVTLLAWERGAQVAVACLA